MFARFVRCFLFRLRGVEGPGKSDASLKFEIFSPTVAASSLVSPEGSESGSRNTLGAEIRKTSTSSLTGSLSRLFREMFSRRRR